MSGLMRKNAEKPSVVQRVATFFSRVDLSIMLALLLILLLPRSCLFLAERRLGA